MEKSECSLILFTKAPIPGHVKTRLIPAIGAEAAAALHEKLVLKCLSSAVASGVGPVDLCCTPSVEHPFFSRCQKEFNVGLYSQTGDDIGERMGCAFRETLKKAPRALLMGTDCPSLTADDLREAATLLDQATDAVITPSEDGGYVLLGLRHFSEDLFREISWGTDRVMQETRLRLHRLGWRWRELPERWDVDDPDDLERLMAEKVI